jgi:DNA-binding NtrC family response regulator
MENTKILVIDDEPLILFSIKEAFEMEGYRVSTASDADEGLSIMARDEFDIVITDLRMPGMDGIELLKKIKNMPYSAEVILITAYGTIESAVEAMKIGAYDYITKPFEMDELLILVKRIQEYRRLQKENIILREELQSRQKSYEIIWKSGAMQKLMDIVETVARTDSTVLIQGESGVGKELVAANIYAKSHRRDKPFVKVSCPELTATLLESELFGHEKGAFTGAYKQRKGRFELAHTGTLFLDEIGELPPTLQAKLLRVLQEKEFERVGGNRTINVNVRIICATKKDLFKEVNEGRYREDLFYRLNVFPIHVPPLRERREDIQILVEHFVKTFSAQLGKDIRSVSPSATSSLLSYSYPGNVRELQNIIERAAILCDGTKISAEHLPSEVLKPEEEIAHSSQYLSGDKTLSEMLETIEKECIRKTLETFKGNKTSTAEALGISRKNLWEKMRKFQL